jgi:putative DNA primase/helicase
VTAHKLSISEVSAAISELMKFELTQYGMADRFIFEQGTNLRYCSEWKSWLWWNGSRWVIDPDRIKIEPLIIRSTRKLKFAAQTLLKSIATIEDKDTRDSMEKVLRHIISHAVGFEARGAFTGMLGFAPALGEVIEANQLDAHPMLLNCKNGVVDLASGKLIPHADTRGYLLTKMAPVKFDPAASCPRWERFLREVFDDDTALVEYIQRAIGYSLTGLVREKAFWFFSGGGDNGKTVLVETIRDMLGDYATAIDTDTLMKERGDDYSMRMTATLHGRRFVVAAETSQGCKLNEEIIKRLTGGDTLVGRHIYGRSFEFTPVHKIFISGNHRPKIRGTDDAVWVRTKLVPFPVQFSDDPQKREAGAKPIDRELRERLEAERAGILAWAVRGCSLWQSEGKLQHPSAVVDAVREYRASQDVVGEFLAQRTDCVAGARADAKDLYSDFVDWCKAENIQTDIAQRGFTDEVKAHGYEIAHGNTGNYFIGLRYRPPIADEWLRQARAAAETAAPAAEEVIQ